MLGKSPIKWRQRPDMTIAVDWDVKHQFKQIQTKQMSCHMGKPTICTGENKGADQLRSNCEADQRLCFRYMDSTFPLLLESEIQASSFVV